MGQNSWRAPMLLAGGKKSVLLKTKDLCGWREKLGRYCASILFSTKPQKHGPEFVARGFDEILRGAARRRKTDE
jgi:hypothetical protein